VFNASGGYAAQLRSTRLSVYLRLNNLLDRRYAGSIIVDDGNGRYFEPAPGFNVFAGFTADFL
jgi:iron complex outermembrane receptor protein